MGFRGILNRLQKLPIARTPRSLLRRLGASIRPPMASSFSFDSLNKAQREAVGALDGPVMLLAGAGTGELGTSAVLARQKWSIFWRPEL